MLGSVLIGVGEAARKAFERKVCFLLSSLQTSTLRYSDQSDAL